MAEEPPHKNKQAVHEQKRYGFFRERRSKIRKRQRNNGEYINQNTGMMTERWRYM